MHPAESLGAERWMKPTGNPWGSLMISPLGPEEAGLLGTRMVVQRRGERGKIGATGDWVLAGICGHPEVTPRYRVKY